MSPKIQIYTLLFCNLVLIILISVSTYHKAKEPKHVIVTNHLNDAVVTTTNKSPQYSYESNIVPDTTDNKQNLGVDRVLDLDEVSDNDDYQAMLSYYGNLIYETESRKWIIPHHETEGCNYLVYQEKETKQIFDTAYRSCPRIRFENSTPLFFYNCNGYYDLSGCLDYSPLKALNLQTGNELIIFNTQHELNTGETYIKGCVDGNFEQDCFSEISINEDTMTIGIFNQVHRPQTYNYPHNMDQPVEFSHTKIRDITIDLSPFYSQ